MHVSRSKLTRRYVLKLLLQGLQDYYDFCLYWQSKTYLRSFNGNKNVLHNSLKMLVKKFLFKSSYITVTQGKVGFSVCAGNPRPRAKVQRLMEMCQPGNCVTSFRRPIVLKRDRSSS